MRKPEIFESLRADVCAGRMYSEDYLSALVRKSRDGVANGDDIRSEVFPIGGAGASAGEWDYFGRVRVL